MKKLLFFSTVLTTAISCSVAKLPLDTSTTSTPTDYVNNVDKKLFANFHGLQTQSNTVVLEGEGMTFTIEKVDLPPIKKSLNKIKNAYMADGDIYSLEKTSFNQPNLILLGGEVIAGDYSTTSLLFIIPAADSTMHAIKVESAFMLDFERAGTLVKDLVDNGLPEYIITENNAAVIDFVGRPLELGNVCAWAKPHSISCTGLGELQWSLFKTADDALMARQINMAITEAKSEGVIDKDENARITFEGTPMGATKVVYKGAEGNSVTAYYVSTFLRGHYVFCKVSFTADEEKGQKLSPLAAKVIAL